jgi:outer membrane protein OmpA-like peptidoglycan-associated protein
MVEPASDCDCYRVTDDRDAGFMLAVGYDLTRYFSVEGYIADLGEAEISNTGNQPIGHLGYRDYGVTALAYFYNQSPQPPSPYYYGPIPRQAFSLYGRFGIGTMDNRSNLPYERGSDVHLLIGAGAEYAWRDGFGLRLEYTAYDADAAMLTFGLVKRFGKRVAGSAAVKYGPTVTTISAPRPAPSERSQALLSVTMPVIAFYPGSDQLDEAATRQLDRFVEAVSRFFKLRFDIKGYAVGGRDEYDNLRLSLARAVRVKNYLIARGISPRRLSSQGLGSGDGDAGDRVEISIR